MLLKQRGRWRGLVPLVALLLPLTVIACGPSMSSAEVGATDEGNDGAVIIALQVDDLATRPASRGLAEPAMNKPESMVLGVAATPSPIATPIGLGTTTPQPSVTATPVLTPSFSPTATATANAIQAAASVAATNTPAVSTPTVAVAAPTATLTPTPELMLVPVRVPGGTPSEALAALNAERARLGLASVNANGQLAAAAGTYAQYMATANFFGHDGPDGSNANSRAIKAGYAGSWRGETLAAGQVTGAAAIDVWLNSPPHRVIVLDPTIREVGIGYYFEAADVYSHYWVLQAGKP